MAFKKVMTIEKEANLHPCLLLLLLLLQVIRPELLRKGFEKVEAEKLTVTDDVSIVEQLPAPVKITVGEYTNIKITTPEDMPMALSILQQRRNVVT